MKYKILYLSVFFLLSVGGMFAQTITPEMLKNLVVKDILDERLAEEWYTEADEKDIKEMKAHIRANKMLDSAIALSLNDYYTRGFCFYPYGRFSNKTLQSLLAENYESLIFSKDLSEATEYGLQYYYNCCMVALFKELHGWNIFQKLYIQAQKIDGSGKGNRVVAFAGGYDAMLKFIYCNLNYFDLTDTSRDGPGVHALLYFNDKGTLDSLKVNDYMLDEEKDWPHKYKNEVERVLRSMPPFVPATDEGKPVPGSFYMEISYYPGMRKHVKCE